MKDGWDESGECDEKEGMGVGREEGREGGKEARTRE